MKKKQVGNVPGNVLGMIADLAHKLQNGVIASSQLGKFLKKENPFGYTSDHSNLIPGWQNFYKDLGLNPDFSNLAIPAKPTKGNRRLLFIADITLETLYAKCKEKFPCWRWTNDNLDKIVAYNERDAKNGAYAVWVKDEMEADEKYKNLSANQIKDMGIKTETLVERLIHELKYFQETGKHLDIGNVTLCSGSRCSDGSVPLVDWGDDGLLGVGRYYSGRYDCLRSREVVS